jgi:hypothetical protein
MSDTEYVAELIRKANELVADLKIDKSKVVEVARLLHEVRKRKEPSVSPYKSGKSDPVAEARKAPRKPMIVRPLAKATVRTEAKPAPGHLGRPCNHVEAPKVEVAPLPPPPPVKKPRKR